MAQHPLHDNWRFESWGRWDNPVADADRYLEKKDADRDAHDAEEASFAEAFRVACMTAGDSNTPATFAPSDSLFRDHKGKMPRLRDIFAEFVDDEIHADIIDVLMMVARGDRYKASALARDVIKDLAKKYAKLEMTR